MHRTRLKFDKIYPALAALPASLRQEIASHARHLRISKGNVLFDTGMECSALPLVLEGRIRVSKRSGQGREIRLYDILPGELCLVTIGCLLGNDTYPATGMVAEELTALALPRVLFTSLLSEDAGFREAVFSLYATRLADLMQLVEELAFWKLDQRLAAWIVAREPLIQVSHQQVADELGSAREIVSRLLEQFEEYGWLRLGRERIEVLARSELEHVAKASIGSATGSRR